MIATGDLVVKGAGVPQRLVAGVAGTYLQGKGAGVLPAYDGIQPNAINNAAVQNNAINAIKINLSNSSTGSWTSSGIGTNYVLPKGLYTMAGGWTIQLQVNNGGWKGNTTNKYWQGTVYSDGTNVRLYTQYSAGETVYWIKLA